MCVGSYVKHLAHLCVLHVGAGRDLGHGIDFLGERKAFAMMSIAVSGVRDSELSTHGQRSKRESLFQHPEDGH